MVSTCFREGTVMHARTIAAIITICLCLSAHTVAAQPQVRSVNPEAIEFEPPIVSGDVIAYRIEVFDANADTRRDPPVKSVDLRARDLQRDGTVRLDLMPMLLVIPDGKYVATIRTVGSVASLQSGSSETFVLSRNGTVED